MFFVSWSIFNGKLFFKLKVFFKVLFFRLNVFKRFVLYIISLFEKGGMVEFVVFLVWVVGGFM